MGKIAFLFPGQGSQSVGMGKDLYENLPLAKQTLEAIQSWVAPDLLDVMFNGPEEALKRTIYTQPAILAVSIVAYQALQEITPIQPDVVAGHSLGEFSALFAAGVLDIEAATKLVKARAICMENAPQGTMAVILGLAQDLVEQAVLETQHQQIGIVTIANYNTPEQFVISGEQRALEAACEKAKALGASRSMLLPVGGAFHSPLMTQADEDFGTTLKSFTFQNAQCPIISNVDAQFTQNGQGLQAKTARQMQSSVRWLDSMKNAIAGGVDTVVEIGPGKVLAGMMKKISRDIQTYNVFDMASLAHTAEALKERMPASCQN